MTTSKRLKADARKYKAAHPGTSYREALRAVAGDPQFEVADGPTITPPPPTPSEEGAGHVPDFLKVLEIDDIATHDFAAVWERNAATNSLSVPYAYRVSGRKLSAEIDHLDLIEARSGGHGPHGGIAGMAGSGKTYLLRSLLLALAATRGPDTINFVLAGFKWRSFDGIDKLPHTALAVDRLEDAADTLDALAGTLTAELARREKLIVDRGGCSDIIEYRSRRAADARMKPLPSLLVVVDDLGNNLWSSPEFTKALVRITRVGRALGVHLLLSSQDLPDGAPKDILQHFTYRISMRIPSPRLSRMMVGTDDAAQLLRTDEVTAPGVRLFDQHPDSLALICGLHPDAETTAADGTVTTMSDALIERLTTIRTRKARKLVLRDTDRPRSGSGAGAQASTAHDEIDSIVGQDRAKVQLHALVSLAEFEEERRRRGLPVEPRVPNCIFTGPRGSGQSHAARVLARALHAAGALARPEVVEVSRRDLVGASSDESVAKTRAVLARARGGVLFIDGAPDIARRLSDPPGPNPVTELIEWSRSMPGNPMVVLSGYEQSMKGFLTEHNVTSDSFPNRIAFETIGPDALTAHLIDLASKLGKTIDAEASELFRRRVQELAEMKPIFQLPVIDELGNLRFARQVCELAAVVSAKRLMGSDTVLEVSADDLVRMTLEDLDAALNEVLRVNGISRVEGVLVRADPSR